MDQIKKLSIQERLLKNEEIIEETLERRMFNAHDFRYLITVLEQWIRDTDQPDISLIYQVHKICLKGARAYLKRLAY